MSTRHSQKPLIAVVDDDELVCRALKRFLLTQGFRVETFTSSRVFAALICTDAAFRPDCVVLDLQMPGLHGLAVQREIGRCRPGVPVVVLAGSEHGTARAEAAAAGAFAIFDKPLYDEIESFAEAVLRAVSH